MGVCSGIKRDGSRCTATVEGPQEYCWWHDPANAGKRRRAAARGGRGGGSGEIREIRAQLAVLYTGTLTGEVDRGIAAVAAQVANVRLRALEVAHKLSAADELEERLSGMEERLRRYGA